MESENKIACAYIRWSTEDQGEGTSPEILKIYTEN